MLLLCLGLLLLETKWRHFFIFRLHALFGCFDGVFAGGSPAALALFRLRCEQAAQEICGLVVLLGDRVGVPAKSDTGVGVAQSGLHGLHVHPVGEPLDGLCSVYAESSLCELLDDFIEEQRLVSRTARQALAVVLAPTRWSIASCDVAGATGCVLCHVNALWALRRVAEVWHGEVEP